MGGERTIYRYQQADSTNRIGKDFLRKGTFSGTVVTTEVQTGGKGQYGRSFSSPPGGLYFSLLLSPSLPPELLPMVTLATGAACAEILDDVSGQSVGLKWPNDLILGKRKLAGILSETVFNAGVAPWVIIGVGINVNSRAVDFPLELRPLVTTLYDVTRQYYSLDDLLEDLVSGIEGKVSQLESDYRSVLADWRGHDYLMGKPVRHIAGEKVIIGRGEGLAEDGRYIIRDTSGKLHHILGGQLRPDAF